MGKNLGRQFNLEKRAILARLIAKERTAKDIAVILGMDPTSISKKVKTNSVVLKNCF